ncbi:MAG: pilin [Candidatus Pacebacteria bacterium]|nr:pilin [Candidatus Paceibacterota bacterium]
MNKRFFRYFFILFPLVFFGIFQWSPSEAQESANGVKAHWGTVELQQNSNGNYTYSINSSGNITRESSDTVYLNVSKTSEQNTEEVSYYTLCSFDASAGLSFSVAYPACANPQSILNVQPGYIYKIYFSDGLNSSKIINNLGEGQGIFQLPSAPAFGGVQENEQNPFGGLEGKPGGDGTTQAEEEQNDPITTTTSSEGEGPTTATTTQESDGGLVSKECGYNLSNGGRICGFSDLIGLLDRIIQFIFILAIPIAALVFAYAGFLYLTSGGNTDKHKKAVKAMTTVVKGILVVMVAWLAVKTILVSLGASPDSAWFWLDVK